MLPIRAIKHTKLALPIITRKAVFLSTGFSQLYNLRNYLTYAEIRAELMCVNLGMR